jgi:hypothetical protein
MATYPVKRLWSEIEHIQNNTLYLTGSKDDFCCLINKIGNLQRHIELTYPLLMASDELHSGQDEANHSNRLRLLCMFTYKGIEVKTDKEDQQARNRLIRSELKTITFYEFVLIGITFPVSDIKKLTDNEIKFLFKSVRQLINSKHLEPYLLQERFLKAVKKASAVNSVQNDFPGMF